MQPRMEEPYREGVATHPDPESCVSAREGSPNAACAGRMEGIDPGCEALTGAPAGEALSREITTFGSRRRPGLRKAILEGALFASARGFRRGLRPSARREAAWPRTGRSHVPHEGGSHGEGRRP